MYLKITSIERIDTNIPADLFVNSDANGIAICIKQVELYNNDGTPARTVKLNDELIRRIKEIKIPV